MINRTLSHYRILEQIGAGGMGVVYRARDERLSRDVAIKVLPQGSLADEDARRRFRREALALSRLNHPNVETVHDFDTQDEIDFLVMEFIPGTTLSDRLAAGPLPEEEIARLGVQLAEGLDAAHAQGIVHRDLKPANLRVTPDHRLKILDFGLAKLLQPFSATAQTETLTEVQEVRGTLPYMAPEQLRGGLIDARTDLYAAGSVLYETATGRRPFPQTQGALLIDAILHEAPAAPRRLAPRLSEGLERIILKALEKDPAGRYQSAGELKEDLERLRRGGLPGLRPRLPRMARAVPAAAVVLGALVAVGWGVHRLLGPGRAPRSLAVLPFINASADPDVEYLSDGITEGIINSISQLPDVRVIARASMFHYKGRQVDPRKVGRELSVRNVLAGRLAHRGEDLLVSAELVDARNSRHLWGQQYNRKFADVVRLQEEIVDHISGSLRLTLTGEQKKRLTKRYTDNIEAYQLYLKGRYYWNQSTEEGHKKSIRSYQEAIRIDPGYALAYAGIAESYYGLSNVYLAPSEAMPLARAAALKALEIDDDLGEAHASLGLVKAIYELDPEGADREFRRALNLNPGYAPAHLWYGVALMMAGRFDDSIEELKRAQDLDPLSMFIRAYGALPLYMAGRYDQALEGLRPVIDMEPGFYLSYAFSGLAYEQKGEFSEAIAAFRKATELDDTPEALAQLGHACAVGGRTREAEEILERLQEISRVRYVSPYNVATILEGLGRRDQAFDRLEKAVEDRSEWITVMTIDPRLAGLRADPRFRALLQRVQGLRNQDRPSDANPHPSSGR